MSIQDQRFRGFSAWVGKVSSGVKGIWLFAWRLVAVKENGHWCVRADFRRDYSYTLFVLLLLWAVDPVDVATNSARSSEELFYRIVSPNYPSPSQDPESKNPFDDTTRIAVVVINDQTLQSLDQFWPPPFSTHEQIIKKILTDSNPKGLFVDFGFFDARDPGEVRILAATLGANTLPVDKLPYSSELWIKDDGTSPSTSTTVGTTPVFLPAAPEGLELIERLENAVTGTVSTRYSTEHELPYNTYVLYDCDAKKPSAALAMYAANNDGWRSGDLTNCSKNWLWEGGKNKLSIFWAAWGDQYIGRGIYGCRGLPKSLFGRIGQIIKIWYFGLFGRDDAWTNQFQTCPPHLAISAHDLLSDDGTLAALLIDRYVFYGGNFAMADDLLISPTHGPVPGVFLHAMALDNLLRDNSYIYHASGSGLMAGPTWLTLVAAIIVVFFIVLAWNGVREMSARPEANTAPGTQESPDNCPSFRQSTDVGMVSNSDQIRAGLWWIGCMSLSLLTVIFAMWIAFSVFRWAPINFVGLFTFMVVHTAARGTRDLVVSAFS